MCGRALHIRDELMLMTVMLVGFQAETRPNIHSITPLCFEVMSITSFITTERSHAFQCFEVVGTKAFKPSKILISHCFGSTVVLNSVNGVYRLASFS